MEETKLQVEYVDVDTLVPYANNAKIHTEKQIGEIANSIREFGFNDPIGVWTNADGETEIVEGHGRVLAAKKLGMGTLPIVRLDHLTDDERRAYAHVHNQTTLTSGFDWDILTEELNILDFDFSSFGFDDFESDDADDAESEPQEVDVPEEAEPRVHKGEVWKLGEHRLMCGDSTDKDSVDKLMGGERADICFTSPPYNMNAYDPFDSAPHIAMHAGAAYGEYGDDVSDDDYASLLNNALANALAHCDDALFNIGVLGGSKHGIAEMLYRFADNICDIIIWNKSTSMPHGMQSQRGMLSHRCELIFCFNQKGTRAFSHPQWDIGTGINRIDTSNASGNKYAKEHSATFPVEFAYEVVKNFTEKSCLDLFGGTGTTMIACEQLGKKCFMMELDPAYCDIIIQRWEDFTGKEAELIESADNL